MEDLPIHLQRIDFKITGMDCADEVAILQSQLTSLAGIKDLAFQILQSKMTVEFDSTVISTDSIVAAIAKTGMRAVPWRKTEVPKTELAGWTR